MYVLIHALVASHSVKLLRDTLLKVSSLTYTILNDARINVLLINRRRSVQKYFTLETQLRMMTILPKHAPLR
jgi:hypothetical protein